MKLWMLGGALLLVAAGCGDDKAKPRRKAEPAPVAAEVAAPSDEEKVQAALEQAEREQVALAQVAEAQAALEKTVQDQTAPTARAEGRDEAQRTAGVLGSAALAQGGSFASLTGTGDISSGFDDADIQGGLLGNEAGEMEGGFGFGRSGFGPGGGTGLGTIGTGRYGTIGRGSGTGSGYGTGGGRGGMRGRTAAVPQVRIGQPQCVGDLDKAIVRRYIKRNIAKITYCYEKQLLARPGLEGTVTTRFAITPNGSVLDATASGVDSEVSSCIASVIQVIEFPKPKNGTVTCSYPFLFRPSGG